MSEVETRKQVTARIAGAIWEGIGPRMLDNLETREAITKIVNDYLDTVEHRPFDFNVECSADPESQTLHVSFRTPPGYYTHEQIDELRAAGVIIEEVKGE